MYNIHKDIYIYVHTYIRTYVYSKNSSSCSSSPVHVPRTVSPALSPIGRSSWPTAMHRRTVPRTGFYQFSAEFVQLSWKLEDLRRQSFIDTWIRYTLYKVHCALILRALNGSARLSQHFGNSLYRGAITP